MKFQKGHEYIGPKEGTFKGKKHTKESKKKMSDSLMGRKPPKTAFKKGIVPWIKGKKSWAKFINLRYEIENGVTLCRECHRITRNKN
ncbi:MAG: NUMOD3 domain-containing DNA-binding protein [Candidatus Bathyarchaeota archaeon]